MQRNGQPVFSKERIMSLIRTTLLGITCVIVLGLFCYQADHQVIKIVPQKEIMSIREQQEFLNSQNHSRYDCGPVDGKPGPLLFKALDNYICDRQAKIEFER